MGRRTGHTLRGDNGEKGGRRGSAKEIKKLRCWGGGGGGKVIRELEY